MTTILLSIALLTAHPQVRVYPPIYTPSPYGIAIVVRYPVRLYRYRTWPLYSPWNQAVAELRASGPIRPRAIAPDDAAALQSLAGDVERLRGLLRDAEADDKAECRREYLESKDRLERARIRAIKHRH